jgi:similar to stage IV sporulation protein
VIRRLLAFLHGWVVVEVRSQRTADLITRLVMAGAAVMDVRPQPGGARWRMTLAGARQLHRWAGGIPARARFEARGGLPFWIRRLLMRPGLMAGVALSFALLAYAVPRVWVVTVVGTSPEVAARVLTAADAAGLRAGVPRSHLDRARVEAEVLRRVPGLAWVGIHLEGAVAVVTLHRFFGRVPGTGPVTRLVAVHAARIVSVRAYLGEVLVAQGQEVQRGTLLMRGWQRGRSRTSAAGEVLGAYRVSATAFRPRVEERLSPTGRRIVRAYLVLSGDVFQLAGFYTRVPAHWRATVESVPLTWFGTPLPGAMVRVVYNEMAAEPVRVSARDALHAARLAAEAAFRRRLQPGARVGSPLVACRENARGAVCTVTADVEQNIAVPESALHQKQP